MIALLPTLRRPGGRVILFSSIAAQRGGGGAYSAAKAALHGWVFDLAADLGPSGITANVICPGYAGPTPIIELQIKDQSKAHGIPEENVIRDIILAHQPTKQFVKLEEIAAFAVFLCTDAAASISGAALPIDGAWTAR